MENSVVCEVSLEGVAEKKEPKWSVFEINLESLLNAAKTNSELYSGFSLFYNEKQFAEKFFEALYPRVPKDPNGPLTIDNYGLPKYFNYGLMGKIGYYEVREKIRRLEKCNKVFEDLKKFTKNVLKKPEERTPFGHEIKTVEKMADFFGQCAY